MLAFTLVFLAPKNWNQGRASAHLDGLQDFGVRIPEAVIFKEGADHVNGSFDLT